MAQHHNHRKRMEQRSGRIRKIQVNDEAFIGVVLSNHFYDFIIQHLDVQGERMNIFHVVDLQNPCEQSFEAKVLSPYIPGKPLKVSQRAVRRIQRSQNYKCQIKKFGKKFLISKVERSDAERDNLWPKQQRETARLEDYPSLPSRKAEFPNPSGHYYSEPHQRPENGQFGGVYGVRKTLTYAEVARAGLREARQVSDNTIQSPYPYTERFCADQPQGLHLSYAKVLARGLTLTPQSTNSKGIRQRIRRQKRRQESRLASD